MITFCIWVTDTELEAIDRVIRAERAGEGYSGEDHMHRERVLRRLLSESKKIKRMLGPKRRKS